jgi:hypothetical protein
MSEETVKLSDLMTLKTASEKIVVDGLKITPRGLWSWCHNGAHGVKMKFTRFAGRIVLTEADVLEYLATVRALESEGSKQGRKLGSPRRHASGEQRARQLEETEKRLKSRGI